MILVLYFFDVARNSTRKKMRPFKDNTSLWRVKRAHLWQREMGRFGQDLFLLLLARRVSKVMANFFKKRSCIEAGALSRRVALIFMRMESVAETTVAARV